MTNLRKAVTAVVVAAVLTGSQALAADGSLAPGKPAGVQQARIHRPNLLLIGAGVTIAVVAVAVGISSGGTGTCSATQCSNATITPTTTG